MVKSGPDSVIEGVTEGVLWGNTAFFTKDFSFILVDTSWHKDCCWVWCVDIRWGISLS